MEVEKTLQFVLEQQAQFVDHLNQLKTVVLELASTQRRIDAILETLSR